MKIINTMNHSLTPDQITELNATYGTCNIINLKDVDSTIVEILSNCPADESSLLVLAYKLYGIVTQYDKVILPIGSPAFMFMFASIYSKDIINNTTTYLFAHSERISEEQHLPDGTVKKVNIFKHIKFIEL